MKDRPNTSIPSELSILYTFISSLFSEPSSERFRLLFEESFREAVAAACETVDGDLLKTLAPILDFLTALEGSVQDEYVSTFGHTLSRPTAPYELEHLRNEDVFYRTQRLADLEGFYRAFGLAVDRPERADHISVEAEFMAHLSAKEAFAREHDLGTEKIEVCRRARRDFSNDHFDGWVPVLAQNILGVPGGQFYPLVSQFTTRFLEVERDRYHESHRPVKT